MGSESGRVRVMGSESGVRVMGSESGVRVMGSERGEGEGDGGERVGG